MLILQDNLKSVNDRVKEEIEAVATQLEKERLESDAMRDQLENQKHKNALVNTDTSIGA